MKHFAILRSVPEDMTWDQVDAAAMQNMSYMGLDESEADIAWEPRALGVKWVRSYWQPGSTWGTCLYTAKDEQAVRDWHDLCQVSYAGIREIEVEEGAAVPAEYPRGFHGPVEQPPLVAVETTEGVRADGWIRAFRDRASGHELQLYLASKAPAGGGGTLRRVVELRPEDYDEQL